MSRLLAVLLAIAAFCPAASAGNQPESGADDFREAVVLEEVLWTLTPRTSWDIDSIREMTRNVSSLPDPAAAEIIWIAASAPPQVDTTNFFANALGSASATVRMVAAGAMAGSQSNDVRRLLLHALSTEQDPDVSYTIVQGLSRLPRNRAVRSLIDIMFLPLSSGETVRMASQELRRLTRADVTDEASAWRDWWLDNEERYE